MGWFLPTKTTKQAARKPAKRGGAKRTWDPARTLRAVRLVAWLLFIGSLGAGWVFGERYLRVRVAEQRSTMPRVELLDLPPWMQQWLINDLRRTIAAVVDPNPFEQLSLQEVAAELEFTPWVRSVNRVTRKPDGVIEIAAAYRQPAALVRLDDGYRLIDVECVCLPGVYDEKEAAKLNLPILVNVAEPSTRAGEPWPGGDVRAGLSLASLVETQSWRDQVKAIDVSNHNGRQDPSGPFLRLRTARGWVNWGRSPDEDGYHEAKTPQKLANVRVVMRDYRGRIDAGGREVDVYGDVPLVHDAVAGASGRN